MRKMHSLLIGLISFALIVTSCNKSSDNSNPNSFDNSEDQLTYDVLTSWTPNVNVTYNPELTPQVDETTPLDPVDQKRLSTTMFDVPRYSSLNMHFKAEAPEYLSCQNVVKNHSYYIEIKDVITNNFQSTLPLTTDGNIISLKFDESFQYGKVYKITLDSNSYLQFENKDPSIQQLVVEMEDDPSEASEYNVCVPKANVPTLNLDNVTEEKVEENSLMSFVYSGTVPELQKGDLFLVKAGSNDDELGMADFYGIFESKETSNNSTKVYYSEPSGDDIFEDFRQKGVKAPDFDNLEFASSVEYIQNQFRYSDTARGLLSFFAKYAETDDRETLGNIMEHLELDIDLNYYDNTILFTFTVGAKKIKLRDNLYLSIFLQYQATANYNYDYDVSLKKEWGVPVGIAYKIKCIKDNIESFSIMVSIAYEKDQPEQDEEEVKNSLFDELRKAKGNQDNFFKKIMDSADAVAQTEGNKTTIPIFKFPFTFPGGMILEFHLDLSFDFTIQAMLLIKKQIKTQDIVFTFSDEGGGDTSNTREITGSNTWDVYFMGKIEFKFALRVAVAWYEAGTYKYFHVEAYGEIWIKVGLQGSLLASFNTDTAGDSFSGNLSIDFYIQFGVDIGIELVIAFFENSWSITLFKAYIFRIYMCNELEHYADNTITRIEMVNKTTDSVNNYDILCFQTWDGVYMQMDTRRFNADDRQSIITLFGQEILGVYMFTFTSDDESLLKIDQEGNITIPDGTPAEFTTHFTIHLHNAISFVQDREIEVYFNAPDAHHIYFQDNIDGVDKGSPVDGGRYRPSYEYVMPDPPTKGGYRFLSYEIDGTSYQPGDQISMPGDDLTIKIKWHKIVYYTVYFVDGKGNIIFVDSHVEEQTAAKEPDAAIRDQYMEGYKFIGWDKNFSAVNSDLIVRGIYAKVGD